MTNETRKLTKTEKQWTLGRAKLVEKGLMKLVKGIPQISHLEGNSYSGTEDYTIRFIYAEENADSPDLCIMEYNPIASLIALNEDVNVSHTPLALWEAVSERAAELLTLNRGISDLSRSGVGHIYGISAKDISSLGRS